MDRPIFTKAAIGRIQAMQDSGSTNKEIAAAIGTTEGSLAARVSQLGLSRYPRHALDGRMRVTFPEQIFTECAPHAARRNLSHTVSWHDPASLGPLAPWGDLRAGLGCCLGKL